MTDTTAFNDTKESETDKRPGRRPSRVLSRILWATALLLSLVLVGVTAHLYFNVYLNLPTVREIRQAAQLSTEIIIPPIAVPNTDERYLGEYMVFDLRLVMKNAELYQMAQDNISVLRDAFFIDLFAYLSVSPNGDPINTYNIHTALERRLFSLLGKNSGRVLLRGVYSQRT